MESSPFFPPSLILQAIARATTIQLQNGREGPLLLPLPYMVLVPLAPLSSPPRSDVLLQNKFFFPRLLPPFPFHASLLVKLGCQSVDEYVNENVLALSLSFSS